MGGVIWSTLYKRDILSAIDWDFSDYSVTEDEFMNIQIYSYTKQVSLVGDQLYFYRPQVTESKETNFPRHNTLKGNKIPMMQTAGDLYSKAKEVYADKKIKYDEEELLVYYIYFINRITQKISHDEVLDKDNQDELFRQRDLYIPQILSNSKISDKQKIRAILGLNATRYLEVFDAKSKLQQEREMTKNNEIRYLREQENRLIEENQQFLGIKRSARLLAGNIKRKLRVRTRLKMLYKNTIKPI